MAFLKAAARPTDPKIVAKPDDLLVNPPTDSISSISFSTQGDYLAVGSWDNTVSVYEVPNTRQAARRAVFHHQAPVLSVCWDKAGQNIISGSVDNTAQLFDCQTGQTRQVAQHEAPIRNVKWVETPGAGLLATGSWDRTLKYWDLRTNQPAATIHLPERCFSMDVRYPWLVAATADERCVIYNLNNPGTPFKYAAAPKKMQTRVISINPVASKVWYALGYVEGRVGIQYIEDQHASNDYSFKCHRQNSSPTKNDAALVYPVNDIAFHPVHGTFSTCGGDGHHAFWDGEKRTRSAILETAPAPIVAGAFNRTGAIYAYGVSYDWHRGYSGMTPGVPVQVKLHACRAEETRPSLNKA
ncbi:hypothetical protein HGRIS_003515 [Hohenbuehelia grisea]|uniref:Mitotic checkpoint protein and poly(A)+ RNA export protein n=1 Tax=Hohenbuehelia grisea TaxID=104357 RepID=A0ABR3JG10_9AGAR